MNKSRLAEEVIGIVMHFRRAPDDLSTTDQLAVIAEAIEEFSGAHAAARAASLPQLAAAIAALLDVLHEGERRVYKMLTTLGDLIRDADPMLREAHVAASSVIEDNGQQQAKRPGRPRGTDETMDRRAYEMRDAGRDYTMIASALGFYNAQAAKDARNRHDKRLKKQAVK